jgi:DNA-binding transcriptional LysR family regulator
MKDFDPQKFEDWCREVLPELATFQAACVFGNRRKAGTTVGKQGPNVGKSISRLETLFQELLNGGSLIDRAEPRRVMPTEAGEELLRYCGQVDSLRAQFLENLEQLQHGSEIRVAMTHYAWLAYGSDLENAYRERRPDGKINFGNQFYGQDKVWLDIEQEVAAGRADIGIYSFPASRKHEISAELAVRNWIDEEIVLVLPPNTSGLRDTDTLSLQDLDELPQVVHYSRSLGFDRTHTIEEYLKRQKVLRQYKGDWLLGVNTISEIRDTLLKKGGISFLPWPAVEQDYRAGALRVFRLDPPMRPRIIRIICRLHTSRRAIAEFMKAAAALEGKRTFPR